MHVLMQAVAAILITIPSIGLQVEAEPIPMPANLIVFGEFDTLGDVSQGDVVTVQTDDDEQIFVVAWSRLYAAQGLPPEVWDGPASGGTVLTLIAPAPSDPDSYPLNRVVRAVPLP